MPLEGEKNNLAFHKEALGGIVIANGLFTGAVFLSVTSTVTPLSGIPSNCMAGNDIIRNLFLFQVGSLVFYSLSSLIATAAKLLVVFFEDTDETFIQAVLPNRDKMNAVARKLSPWMLPVMISSVMCSGVGSFFLVLSIINMVQIKLGLVSCGNTLVVITAVGTALLLFFGLVIYLFMSWYFIKHVYVP